VFGWIAPRDRGGGERRFLTGSGVSFGVEHVLILDARQVLRYAKHAIVHSKHASVRVQSEGMDTRREPEMQLKDCRSSYHHLLVSPG
jgi:hypothetical protein